jgi:hypothetical protein
VSESLCRHNGHTCAACCWGDRLDRPTLTRLIRRQTRLFARLVGRRPTGFRLAFYEVIARRGLDLVLAALLWIPLLSDLLRPWLRRRMACAFLGFEDEAETRVGCLLHPTRWQGEEKRPQAAFHLLRGLGCGTPDYLCLAALLFARGWSDRERFRRESANLDWYDFSQAASALRPASRRVELPVFSESAPGLASPAGDPVRVPAEATLGH